MATGPTLVVVVDGQSADESVLQDVVGKLVESSALVQLGLCTVRTTQPVLCTRGKVNYTDIVVR